jgi:hypothetical protein
LQSAKRVVGVTTSTRRSMASESRSGLLSSAAARIESDGTNIATKSGEASNWFQ